MTRSSSRQLQFVSAVLTLLVGLFAAGLATATAQAISTVEGAPVDIHSGTCDDFLLEPVFDGGEISPTTLDETWEDERLQAGILVDEQAGASGVDQNGDGAIQENEVIAPTGEDATIGMAEAELDGEIDASQPHVVVVHASADAYDTVVACGEVTSVENGDTPTVIPLQAEDDAAIFGFATFQDGGQSMATFLFEPGTPPETTPVATADLEPEGHPMDIHPGTCEDWTLEPTYDLGTLQETNVAAEGAQAPGDMSGDTPPQAETLGPVFKADAENEFGADQLLNEGPFIVGVHESAENYDQLIACGEILPIYVEDQLLVILKPVGTGMQTGTVLINQENGTTHGFLWDCEPIEPATHAEATPLPTQEPTPEPTPTPTEEATAVIVETVVIEETEVVPAPTATAEAEAEEEGD